MLVILCIFFFKQKTAYEMRISDWSSDVCSSDLAKSPENHVDVAVIGAGALGAWTAWHLVRRGLGVRLFDAYGAGNGRAASNLPSMMLDPVQRGDALYAGLVEESREAWQRLSDSASLPILTPCEAVTALAAADRSEEHTSELQSLMRISYAVF